MGFIDRAMHEAESLFAFPFDFIFGRGGDGVPGSSLEQYYRPDEQQAVDVHIHASTVDMTTQSVQVEPVHDAPASPAPEQTDHQTERQAQEQAYWEMVAKQELQRTEQELTHEHRR